MKARTFSGKVALVTGGTSGIGKTTAIEFARAGDSYSLKDLNSTNGTQINGDFVTDAELKDGDTIRFGSVIAVFAGAYANLVQATGLESSGRVFRAKAHSRLRSR